MTEFESGDATTKSKEPAKPQTHEASKLALQLVGPVFLAFGGALLTFYYAQIHYFPEISWQDSFTFLAAISLLGGGAALTYSLLVFIPGIVWSELLIFDTKLKVQLCRSEEPCYRNVGIHLALPFLVFMAAVHGAKLLGWVEPVGIGGLAGLIVFYGLDFKAILEPQHPGERSSHLAKVTSSAALASLASLISLLILYHFIAPDNQGRPNPLLLLVCTTIVVLSNFFVSVWFRKHRMQAVTTGILAGLVLLFCGEILSEGEARHSKRIMGSFGLGGDKEMTLIVNDNGRSILENLGFSPTAAPPSNDQPKKSPSQTGCWMFSNARMLSYIGKQYYVQIEGRSVILPREVLTAWAEAPQPTGEPLAKGQCACADTGHELRVDFGATLVGVLLGLFLGWGSAQLQRRPKMNLWQKIASGRVSVFVLADSFYSPCFTELVLTEINLLLNQLHLLKGKPKLCSSDQDCEVILKGMHPELKQSLNRARIRADYGLIYWLRGPDETEKDVLIIAGNGNDIILAAAQYLVSPSCLSLFDGRGSGAFELLMRIDDATIEPEVSTVFFGATAQTA